MVVVHVDRDCFAVFACLQADSRRRMNLFFHAVLLRENACSYSQVYQKEQRPFNLRSAHGASWVGSSNRSASNLRYATRSSYNEEIDHYDVRRTIEEQLGIKPVGSWGRPITS